MISTAGYPPYFASDLVLLGLRTSAQEATNRAVRSLVQRLGSGRGSVTAIREPRRLQ